MQKEYTDKLKQVARDIAKYQALDDCEKKWLYHLLRPGYQKTITMLDLIEQQPMTYEEIALEMGCNKLSVTQKLNALKEGGYPIDLTECVAISMIGRPRVLARR